MVNCSLLALALNHYFAKQIFPLVRIINCGNALIATSGFREGFKPTTVNTMRSPLTFIYKSQQHFFHCTIYSNYGNNFFDLDVSSGQLEVSRLQNIPDLMACSLLHSDYPHPSAHQHFPVTLEGRLSFSCADGKTERRNLVVGSAALCLICINIKTHPRMAALRQV